MGKIPAIPSIPTNIDINLRTFLSSIKTTIDYREGRLQDKSGRFITTIDLPNFLAKTLTKPLKLNLNNIISDGVLRLDSHGQLTIVSPDGIVIHGERGLTITGGGSLAIDTEKHGAGLIVGDFHGGEGWQINNKGLVSYTLNNQLHAFANVENIPWQRVCSIDGVYASNPYFTLGAGDVVLGMFNYEYDGIGLGGIFWDQSDRKLYIRGEVIAGTGSDIDWSSISGSKKAADNADVTAFNNFWSEVVDDNALKPFDNADVTQTILNNGADISGVRVSGDDLIVDGKISTSLLEISNGRTFSVLGSGKLYINTNTDEHGLLVGDWNAGEGWQINNKGIFSYSQSLAMTAFSTYLYDVPWQRQTMIFPAGTISPVNPNFNMGPGDAIFGPFNYKWDNDEPAGGLFVNTFDPNVSGSKTAVYLKGDIHIDGNVSITGEAVTFDDWDKITGSNFPEPNATQNTGVLANLDMIDSSYITDAGVLMTEDGAISDSMGDLLLFSDESPLGFADDISWGKIPPQNPFIGKLWGDTDTGIIKKWTGSWWAKVADVTEKTMALDVAKVFGRDASTIEDIFGSFDKAEEARIAAQLYADEKFVNSITHNLEIAEIQDQLDKSITTHYYAGLPGSEVEPEINWTTDALRNLHLGDLYYDKDTGKTYRYLFDDPDYKWVEVVDQSIIDVMEKANQAFDIATDHKRRIFVDTPVTPYDIGDMWIEDFNEDGVYTPGEIKRSTVDRTESESYNLNDWVLASKYTDDSQAFTLHDIAVQYADNKVSTFSFNAFSASDLPSAYDEDHRQTYMVFEVSTPQWPADGTLITRWINDDKAIQILYDEQGEGLEWVRVTTAALGDTWSVWKKKEVLSPEDFIKITGIEDGATRNIGTLADLDEITENELYADLNTRIDLIDTPILGLVDRLQKIEISITTVDFDAEAGIYVVGDFVVDNENIYKCIQDTISAPPPSTTNTEYWKFVGEKVSISGVINANASFLSDIEIRVTENEGEISSHVSEISALEATVNNSETGVTVNASRIDSLDLVVTENSGDISSNISSISGLEATVNDSETGVTANAAQVNSLDLRASSIEGEVSAHASSISGLISTVNDPETGVVANTAAIEIEQNTRASADSSMASTINTVLSTLGEHTTSIQTHASSIDGIQGKYSVKIDNNGYVSGFGLISTDNDGEPFSEMIMLIDSFKVVMPGEIPLVPFSIGMINGIPTVTVGGISNQGELATKDAAFEDNEGHLLLFSDDSPVNFSEDITWGSIPPSEPFEGQLWGDKINGNVKEWTGTEWRTVSDITGHSVAGDVHTVAGTPAEEIENIIGSQDKADEAKAKAIEHTNGVVLHLSTNSYTENNKADQYIIAHKVSTLIFEVDNSDWPEDYGGVITHWYTTERATQICFGTTDTKEYTRETNPSIYPNWTTWTKKEIYSSTDVNILLGMNAPVEAGATAGATWKENINGLPADEIIENSYAVDNAKAYTDNKIFSYTEDAFSESDLPSAYTTKHQYMQFKVTTATGWPVNGTVLTQWVDDDEGIQILYKENGAGQEYVRATSVSLGDTWSTPWTQKEVFGEEDVTKLGGITEGADNTQTALDAHANLINTIIGNEDLTDGGLFNTKLMEISDDRTLSIMGSGYLYIETNTDGAGIIVGDWVNGEGWQINNKGIFNYTQGAQVTAFSSYINPVAWQQANHTFVSGLSISPIVSDFKLGPSDAVFGLFNYKWDINGEHCGGLLINNFDENDPGNTEVGIYIRGNFHIQGDVSITGEAVTFDNWDKVTGTNLPVSNAQVNTIEAGDGLDVLDSSASTKLNGIPSNADNTSSIVSAMAYEDMVSLAKLDNSIITIGGYLKASLIETSAIIISDLSGAGTLAGKSTVDYTSDVSGSKPPTNADNTVSNLGSNLSVIYNDNGVLTLSSSTIKFNSLSNLIVVKGADLIMEGDGTNTSIINFKPNPSDSNTWFSLESDIFTGGSPRFKCFPNNNNAGLLTFGSDDTNTWNFIGMKSFAGVYFAVNDNIDSLNFNVLPDKVHVENGSLVVDEDLSFGGTKLNATASEINTVADGSTAKNSHTHNYASSTDSRFLTTTQKTDLTDGNTCVSHNHTKLNYGENALFRAWSSYNKSYGSLYPDNNTNRSLGNSSYYWDKIYGNNIYYKNVSTFDIVDDLEVIDNIKAASEKKTNAGKEIPISDSKTIPKFLTNRDALWEEVKEENGDLITEAEFDELIDDPDGLEWRLHYNMGDMVSLAQGGIRQLNKELTEDVYEEFNSLIEDLLMRVNALEKELIIN